MLPIQDWRIYYDDGSDFSSRDGPWADAPAEGVQAVMLYHSVRDYRTIIAGIDEYLIPGQRAVKYGRWMTDRDYEAVVARAMRDERR